MKTLTNEQKAQAEQKGFEIAQSIRTAVNSTMYQLGDIDNNPDLPKQYESEIYREVVRILISKI